MTRKKKGGKRKGGDSPFFNHTVLELTPVLTGLLSSNKIIGEEGEKREAAQGSP